MNEIYFGTEETKKRNRNKSLYRKILLLKLVERLRNKIVRSKLLSFSMFPHNLKINGNAFSSENN